MTIKKLALISAFILSALIIAVICVFQSLNSERLDPVAVNDLAKTVSENWGHLDSRNLPCRRYKLDYAVVDSTWHLVAETRSGIDTNQSDAVRSRDTVVDLSCRGRVVGKLIVYNNTAFQWEQYRDRLLFVCTGVILLLILLLIIYSFYIDRTIFRPFRKLKAFASHVAEGNLDVPLLMDKGNMFGAFTESFDLMRDELAKAREGERQANESKKELVASLSHDIKTPVASIKALSEIMAVKTADEEGKRRLAIIDSKADQINNLITNLFNATLEELQKLSVTVSEHPSTLLDALIKNADIENRAKVSEIPGCIIAADCLRLTQVIDNIVNNSYKYAGTAINVSARTSGRYLEIEFRDFGKGVLPDELPLLFSKFYRAKNAEGKSGAGLGLYISKYLMEKMSGDIACRNTEDGFAVTIKLRLA